MKSNKRMDRIDKNLALWWSSVTGRGPCVCFDLPFTGSAGGSPDLHSFDRSTLSFINDSVLTNHNDY